MRDNRYIACVNINCNEKIQYENLKKLHRIHVSNITRMIYQAIFYRENLKTEQNWQQKLEQREQELLNKCEIQSKATIIYKKFEAILNPISPCCHRAFDYDNQECDAVTCEDCKVRFCGLCLGNNTIYKINEDEVCPVHNHVKWDCLENRHYRGNYFTNPWYRYYRYECRFVDEWNDWIEETDDDKLVELVYERIKMITIGTRISFFMDNGTTELLKSLTGKYHTRIQLTTAEENELKRKKRKCGICREIGHDRRQCPVQQQQLREEVREEVREDVREDVMKDIWEMDFGEPGQDLGEDFNEDDLRMIIDMTQD